MGLRHIMVSFTRRASGDLIQASDINDLQSALEGVTHQTLIVRASGGDDTTALNAAGASLPKGGLVLLPDPSYAITQPITAPVNVEWRGAGRSATVISCTGCSAFVATDTVLRWGGIRIRDLTVKGDYSAHPGISLDHRTHSRLENIIITQFGGSGLVLNWAVVGSFRDSLSQANDGDGIVLGPAANAWTCSGDWEITANNGWGITALGNGTDYCSNLTLTGGAIEGNRCGGLRADYANLVSITTTDFESNNTPWRGQLVPDNCTHIALGTQHPVQAISVRAVSMTNVMGALTGYGVDLGTVDGYDEAACYFGQTGQMTAAHRMSANVTHDVIGTSNVYTGVTST